MAANGFLPLIESFLALALSLAALATIATVVVEVMHRAMRLRFKTQRLILESLFDEYVAPQLRRQGVPDLATLRADFLGNVLESPLKHKIRLKLLGSSINLTAEDVLRRLPETQLFQQARAQARQQIEQELLRFADRYESYARDASDYFKRRAQMTSLIVGVVFALLANVDGLRLFESYRADPELAAQVIELLDEEASRTGDGAPDADDVAAIREQIGEIRGRLSDLSQAGVPIGWGFYPNCFAGRTPPTPASVSVACRDAVVAQGAIGASVGTYESIRLTFVNDTTGFLEWLVTVMVTGLMIGLGGPFWYDVARRLTQVRGALSRRVPEEPEPPAVPSAGVAVAGPPPLAPAGLAAAAAGAQPPVPATMAFSSRERLARQIAEEVSAAEAPETREGGD